MEGLNDLRNLNPDLMITCAFGQILSQEIIDLPKFGVINIHASLLPKYRGASPIHYALMSGEKQTGITIMKTDIGIDTGDMIMQKSLEILPDETCGELFYRLSNLGAELLMEALPSIENGTARFIKQDENEATFTKIIRKEMAKIDWSESAEDICNKIRAFNPAPIAYCDFEGNPFKIYSAKVVDMTGNSGKILSADNGLVIACGRKALSLLKVQKAGGKPMDIKDFMRGAKLTVNEDFC